MTRHEMHDLIRSDLQRIKGEKISLGGGVTAWLSWGSYKITLLYRHCNYWYHQRGLGAKIILALLNLIYKHYQFKIGVDLPYRTQVGRGLLFMHFGGIVVSKDAVIGDNVTIFQGVTIGKGEGGAPVIGDDCSVFAGAKVLGGITLGKNVTVGANAVVLKDCPDNAVVAGVPAKVLRIKES